MKHITRCAICASYTMHATHCDAPTLSSQPAKWSPEDKYAHYRREAKTSHRKEANLI